MSRLSSRHILPLASSIPIAVLSGFMMVLCGFCLLGLFGIQSITQNWLSETQDKLTIEVLAYDKDIIAVLDQAQLDTALIKIEKYLDNDPIVTSIDIQRFETQPLIDSDLTIPAPIFVVVNLLKNRIDNAEDRLMANITNLVPNTNFKTIQNWERDINQTATTLKVTFGGLTLCILIVTGVILIGFIKGHLKSNDQTIQIIHLMGADSSKIAALFQKFTFIPLILGLISSIIIISSVFTPALLLIDVNIDVFAFSIALLITNITFIALCQIVTYITVTHELRNLP